MARSCGVAVAGANRSIVAAAFLPDRANAETAQAAPMLLTLVEPVNRTGGEPISIGQRAIGAATTA